MKFFIIVLLILSNLAFAITESDINKLAKEFQFTETKFKKENKNVTFSGLSPSWKAIAEFLDKIKNDGHKNVRFNGKGKVKSNKRPFVITFREK